MIVNLNGKKITLGNNNTIVSLLEQEQLAAIKGIAIAINNKVIPKNNWDSYELKNEDVITLIRATQGG